MVGVLRERQGRQPQRVDDGKSEQAQPQIQFFQQRQVVSGDVVAEHKRRASGKPVQPFAGLGFGKPALEMHGLARVRPPAPDFVDVKVGADRGFDVQAKASWAETLRIVHGFVTNSCLIVLDSRFLSHNGRQFRQPLVRLLNFAWHVYRIVSLRIKS